MMIEYWVIERDEEGGEAVLSEHFDVLDAIESRDYAVNYLGDDSGFEVTIEVIENLSGE